MKTTKPIQIKTVEQLQAAAYEKRCVVCPNHSPGMTLRDWLAGQAMIGMCSANARLTNEPYLSGVNPQINMIAWKAYLMADAMIAARDAVKSDPDSEPTKP